MLVLLSLGCFSSVAETLHRYPGALAGQGHTVGTSWDTPFCTTHLQGVGSPAFWVTLAHTHSLCSLSSMRYFDRAALFVEACLQYGALPPSDETHILCQCPWGNGEHYRAGHACVEGQASEVTPSCLLG